MSATNTNTNSKSNANLLTASFSILVYGYSVAALISWWFFLVPNQFLSSGLASSKPYSIEQAPTATSIGQALSVNLGATFLFGFFHSLLARKSVKKQMNLPTSMERPFYCLQGAFFLHMIMHFWLDVNGTTLWDFSDSIYATRAILSVFWLGSAFLLSATFALDHFHLFGLSQGLGMDLNGMIGLTPKRSASTSSTGLATRWHYNYVAHPIMTGMFLNLWATPVMTPARLGLALFLSLYIVVAVIRLEEKTLKAELGADYDAYLAKTPRFFPFVSLTNSTTEFRVKVKNV